MHILFITPGFAKDEQDTPCIPPLQLLAKTLHEKGVRISILALDYPHTQKKYDWNGIPVYPCGGNNRRGPAKLKTLFTAWRIIREIDKVSPIDLVHSFWLQDTAMLGARFAKKKKLPQLITLMGQDVLPENKYLKRFDFSSKPYIVALSEFHRSLFEKSTGKSTNALIHFGIDHLSFGNKAAEGRDIDLLGVGWLAPVKQYDQFIRTVAQLKTEGLHVNAVIAGDGSERKQLESLAQELGVSDRVRFSGLLSREEVLAIMKRSKILLHPSRHEGFGYVFAEAQAAGMKIVSYPVGIAEASERWAIATSEDTLVKAAGESLREPFMEQIIIGMTMDETAQRYLDLYHELTTKKDTD